METASCHKLPFVLSWKSFSSVIMTKCFGVSFTHVYDRSVKVVLYVRFETKGLK